MESGLASTRSPRKLQQRHILAASANRKRRDSTHGRSVANLATTADNPFLEVSLQKHHSEASRSLSELVYTWCINDLDYRPGNIDTRMGSHVGALTHGSTSTRPLPEFSPESIDRAIHASQIIDSNRSERIQVSIAGHMEREAIALRNRDLTLAIAQKQREIAEAKERIKQQRQLQVAKEIHHRQSVQIVKVLQEYDTLLRQYQPNTLKSTTWFQENDSDHYALRATIEKVLREVSRTIELVTIKYGLHCSG
ncbi:hypothetical protein EDD21DRAFT_239702 [Dissophora ornata]|nr:hypothetical protein EDD21DRAFT_239702 [Dissophora ornata]